MVARIHKGHSISRALNYNEQKCGQAKAVCLFAGNYIKDAGQMNFHEKIERLKDLCSLNKNVKANSVHISLNFDNKDRLDQEILVAIAEDYLQAIGFGDQPYLVYQHIDAGHPHLHIVTTNVEKTGQRIDMHNIGRNQSEVARKAIELKYKLVQAEGKRKAQSLSIMPLKLSPVVYGKTETKKSIAGVVEYVLGNYHFSSLPELNAVLKTFNVCADSGEVGSQAKKTGGLYFRILDENGNKTGIPVKASLFYMKPTLANLEKIFEAKKLKNPAHKKTLASKIDRILISNPRSLEKLISELSKLGVDTILRKNQEGFTYGITFVDHQIKCVFNGSDLGKTYSIKSIGKRLTENGPLLLLSQTSGVSAKQATTENPIVTSHFKNDQRLLNDVASQASTLIDTIINPQEHNENIPWHLKKKKRKRQSQ